MQFHSTLQLHFIAPKSPLLLDHLLYSPFYFPSLSGLTHIYSHWDLFLVKCAEIKLYTLEFCLRGTHNGERIYIIPCFGVRLYLFSRLLITQIHRAFLYNICISLFTNHFDMHLIFTRTAEVDGWDNFL